MSIGLCKLTCLIEFGKEDINDPSNIINTMAVNEVVDIDITSSYSNLTNKAKITFPRAITLKTSGLTDGIRDTVLTGDDPNNPFQKGMRVRIWLGYNDPGDNSQNNKMFDGFITGIETKNPFILHCEDYGYKLKQNCVSPITTGIKGTKVNDVIDHILAGTGLKLHPLSHKMNIEIGQIVITKNQTAADVLSVWRKYGLMAFIKSFNGVPCLSLSRTFFSLNTEESLISGESDTPPIIDFCEHVAADNLRVQELDYNLLALEATTLYPDNSMYKVTIRRDPCDASKFQEINETKLSKSQVKKRYADALEVKENMTNTINKQNKINLSNYNIRTYHQYNLSPDALKKNAKSVFTQISQTGVEGDLVLFGDFGLSPASMVRLHDRRNPERNGVYIISEVHTSFGTKGYRQKIKIPHKRGA
ncbi:MAG: hypothetical protein ACRDD8_05980 [Bacteroidales bacterium]